MNTFTFRIQIISIIVSLILLLYNIRLIVKGKLREEYAIFWVICTLILVIFSFWRDGLDFLSKLMGVYDPPNLVFMGAIFSIFIYLLHFSIVVSKLQAKNKDLAQKISLLMNKLEANEAKESDFTGNKPK